MASDGVRRDQRPVVEPPFERQIWPVQKRDASDAVVVPAEAAAVVGDASADGEIPEEAVDDEYARMMAELGGG